MKKLLVFDLDGTLWEQKDMPQMVLKFEVLRFEDTNLSLKGICSWMFTEERLGFFKRVSHVEDVKREVPRYKYVG